MPETDASVIRRSKSKESYVRVTENIQERGDVSCTSSVRSKIKAAFTNCMSRKRKGAGGDEEPIGLGVALDIWDVQNIHFKFNRSKHTVSNVVVIALFFVVRFVVQQGR